MKIHKTKENKLSKLVQMSGNRSGWLEETTDKWKQDCANDPRRSITYHGGYD